MSTIRSHARNFSTSYCFWTDDAHRRGSEILETGLRNEICKILTCRKKALSRFVLRLGVLINNRQGEVGPDASCGWRSFLFTYMSDEAVRTMRGSTAEILFSIKWCIVSFFAFSVWHRVPRLVAFRFTDVFLWKRKASHSRGSSMVDMVSLHRTHNWSDTSVKGAARVKLSNAASVFACLRVQCSCHAPTFSLPSCRPRTRMLHLRFKQMSVLDLLCSRRQSGLASQQNYLDTKQHFVHLQCKHFHLVESLSCSSHASPPPPPVNYLHCLGRPWKCNWPLYFLVVKKYFCEGGGQV